MTKHANLLNAATAASALMLVWLAFMYGAGYGGTSTIFTPGAPQEAEKATVVDVLDGDTVVIDEGRQVQIIGVNCPESKNPGGPEGTDYTTGLLLGREVTLESDKHETDRYGRLLRHVWVADELASARIIADGYAVFKAFPPGPEFQKHTSALEAAEEKAREEEAGLWAEGILKSQLYD